MVFNGEPSTGMTQPEKCILDNSCLWPWL